MKQQNRLAVAYLLVGIAAAGRALLAMPDGVELQEVSLTALALVGYLLLCRRTWLPLVCGAAQLVLELILCGSQSGGVWSWLAPGLRAADLWLLLAASVWMLRQAEQPSRKMPVAAVIPLSVYTVTHFLPQMAMAASLSFVVFSITLLWYAVLMLRAYNTTRTKV